MLQGCYRGSSGGVAGVLMGVLLWLHKGFSGMQGLASYIKAAKHVSFKSRENKKELK